MADEALDARWDADMPTARRDAGERASSQTAADARAAGIEAPKRSDTTPPIGAPTTLPVVLSGLLAWAVTVAPAGFARGAAWHATGAAALAAIAAFTGPTIFVRRPLLGRHVGITAFVALSTATWLGSSAAIHPLHLDSIRGVFGAIAWAVFVLSWSERWSSRSPVVTDGDAPALQPRATLPMLAVPIGAVGVVASVVFLQLAWSVSDPERALVSHAVAVGCAVAVVTAAAQVATARGRRKGSGSRRFNAVAIRSITLLVVVAAVGAVVLVLR